MNSFFITLYNVSKQPNNQTMTISPMNMNELLTQLKTTKDNVGSVLAHGLRDNNNSNILQILETCDIHTLEEVKHSMNEYSTHLFDIIMERRMNYINSVRRTNQEKMKIKSKTGGDDENENDKFIDLNRDQDDTQNLACGMTVISTGIEKMNNMIERKKKEIKNKTPQLNQPRNIAVFIFLIIVCIIVVLCKSSI